MFDLWSAGIQHVGHLVVMPIKHENRAKYPANCDDDNLAHLCQRCHNIHDMPMRIVNAARSRKAGNAIGDLFGEQT